MRYAVRQAARQPLLRIFYQWELEKYVLSLPLLYSSHALHNYFTNLRYFFMPGC